MRGLLRGHGGWPQTLPAYFRNQGSRIQQTGRNIRNDSQSEWMRGERGRVAQAQEPPARHVLFLQQGGPDRESDSRWRPHGPQGGRSPDRRVLQGGRKEIEALLQSVWVNRGRDRGWRGR